MLLRPMVKVWLYLSIATLVFSIFTFFPGVFVGMLAIIGSSMHVCSCCKGDPSLAGPVAVTYVLAMITACIDGFIVGIISLQWLFLVGSGCAEKEMREDGEDGFIERDLEREEKEGKPECFVIVMVISVTLGWYLLHMFVTSTPPRPNPEPVTSLWRRVNARRGVVQRCESCELDDSGLVRGNRKWPLNEGRLGGRRETELISHPNPAYVLLLISTLRLPRTCL
jgi:hypothetical protein